MGVFKIATDWEVPRMGDDLNITLYSHCITKIVLAKSTKTPLVYFSDSVFLHFLTSIRDKLASVAVAAA